MEKELTVVGSRVPMLDAAAKVKGAAEFTDDLTLPGMLHGKLLRSPFPHAKILHVDTSKAERLPGVKGVMTGQDIPDRKYGIVPKAKDEYALAKTVARYMGDEVAAVCAIDPEIAEEALELIEVDYEELPAVFDPLEAIKEGAPLVHDDYPITLLHPSEKNLEMWKRHLRRVIPSLRILSILRLSIMRLSNPMRLLLSMTP